MKNVYKRAQTNGLAIESSFCSCTGTEFIPAPISQPQVTSAPGDPMASSGPSKSPSTYILITKNKNTLKYIKRMFIESGMVVNVYSHCDRGNTGLQSEFPASLGSICGEKKRKEKRWGTFNALFNKKIKFNKLQIFISFLKIFKTRINYFIKRLLIFLPFLINPGLPC